MTTKISVALCTHNGARFIGEQVASILAQTLAPTELVVSDDASTDDTVRVIEQAVATCQGPAPTLRIIRNPLALGVVRNFEQAVTICTGDLIVLCDQDDRWTPGRLERLVAAFESDPELLLLNSDAQLIDDDGRVLGYSLFETISLTRAEKSAIHSGHGLSVLLRRNTVTGATTMFRRTLLDRALPFPDSWVHDEWLAVIAAAFGRFDFLEDELIDYRQHSGNVIGATKLGLGARFRKLREPRVERNRRLHERAAALVARLRELDAPDAVLTQAESKLEHEDARSSLPVGHLARLAPVLRGASQGRYRAYGRGAQDVLRDLVQPAR